MPHRHKHCPIPSCPVPTYSTVKPQHNDCSRRAISQFKVNNIKVNNIKAKTILPMGTDCSIGTVNNKFKRICANELYINRNSINFGNVKLSTTTNGNFYCRVNGKTKRFKYDSDKESPGPQGAAGPQGAPGLQGIAGSQGPQGVAGSQGPQGAQGAQGDPASGPVSLTDNVLTVDNLRNLPCNNLSQLFCNSDTNEISYDGSVLSYTDLISLVKQLQDELNELKTSLN